MGNKKSIVLVLLLAVALLFVYSGAVKARSGYLSEFNLMYGTSGTKLDDCIVCHIDNQTRNPYGQDIEFQMTTYGYSVFNALYIVEPYDSDGDSFSNIYEIQSLTYPGDPLSNPTCKDMDNDGYSPDGGECGPYDCHDNDPTINPGAVEDCTDGIDNDCDGLIDTADPDAVNCPVTCRDMDSDGYSTNGGECGPIDCNDADPAVNPGAVEVCDDTIDNDCDGLADCNNDPDCDIDPVCGPVCEPAKEVCDDGIDNDCDTLVDCDDRNCKRFPACAPPAEICDDGIDNDGDGKIDCADKKDCNKDPAC